MLLPAATRSDELAAALRYSLLAPGKRIRPILTILAAWELGADDLRALDAGCALEMVHAASLILDDLPAMDNARERRGQPATHIRFGEDVAMLAAITLLSLAYGTIGSMAHVPSDVRCRIVGILARAVGPDGLTGGQFADLRPGAVGQVQDAADINRRKTGALFEAATAIAAAIHEADDDEAAPLHRFAGELGQAFQILDDLLDGGIGEQPEPAQDAGKTTILSLVGRDATRQRLRQHLETAVAGLRPSGPLSGFVRSIFGTEFAAPEPA